MKIQIIGNGAFGTALATLVDENKHEVLLLGKGKKISASDMAILAVPTQSIRSVLTQLKEYDVPIIVNCAKGIEEGSHQLPVEIFTELFGEKRSYATLMGPSFAGEMVKQMPTLVNVGSFELQTGKIVQDVLQTDYFRIRVSYCVHSLELSGALKNVYAIAAGFSRGLGLGINTQTQIIILALEEITRLCRALKFPIDESADPGIIGDLILTGNSSESRNFRLGKLLATNTIQESLAELNALVEGYSTAFSIPYFAKKAGVKMLLAEFMQLVVKM